MKTLKNKLFIVLFAVMFLSFAGFAATNGAVYAENDEFTVNSVTCQLRETFDDLRTEYFFKFNADKDILSEYANNTEITIADFDSKVKVNETAISGVQGGYKLYREGYNLLKVVLARPLGYVYFTLLSGVTIGGCTLKNDVILYQDTDGNFITTEPEYRANAVFACPYGADGNITMVQIAMTKPEAANAGVLSLIKVNGKALNEYDASTVMQDWSNDWDAGYAQYHFRVFLANSLINGGTTITFPQGFTTGGKYTTAKEQSFYLPAGNYGDWNNEPSWKPVSAEEKEFGITGIEFCNRQTFKNLGGIRTEYLFNFSAEGDVLSDFENGAEIWLPFFGCKIKANATPLNGLVNSDATTGRYRLFKESENCLRVSLGSAIGYVSFTLPAGLSIGNYSLKENITLYQGIDGKFTTSEPEYRVNGVFARPYYTAEDGNSVTMVQIAMTKANAVNQAGVDSILINGKALSEYGASEVRQWNDGGVLRPDYSNDWDDGYAQYHFRIFLSNSFMNGGTTITFPKGFTTGGAYATEEEQSFYLGAGIYGDWANEPTWTYVSAEASVDIAYASRTENSVTYELNYAIASGNVGDIFSAFAVGADMTDFVNGTDISDEVIFNSVALRNYNVAYKKSGANKIELTINEKIVPPTIMVNSGYVLNGIKIFGAQKLYTSDSDYRLKSGFDAAIVTDITSETSYGTMSKDTQVRFSVKLDTLGAYSGFEDGRNLTEYLNNPSFTDKVLFNGTSLTVISASNGVEMYKGGKDAEVYGKTSDSIEIIIKNAQIFDYDVTVLKGCIIGNLEISETLTYRKNYEENFDKAEEEESVIKPIAIREIPNGDITARTIQIIFNGAVKNNDLVDAIEFSNAKDGRVELEAKGGKYFNPESIYGYRCYTLVLGNSEYTEFVISDTPKVKIGSVKTESGKDTEEKTFVMKKGTWVSEGDEASYTVPEITEVLHPGNQDNDLKLFMFRSNVSYNFHLFPQFIKNNLYVNGKLVSSMPFAAGYVNPELSYDCKCFAIYINDNLRNYEGGVDVLYLKAGAPLSAGRVLTEDVYFYAVQNKGERDGAGNWIWKVSKTAPALKLLNKETFNIVDGKAEITVLFDRNVAVDSVLFGNYNPTDVSGDVLVNGKTLSEYGADASYSWLDNGISIKIPQTALNGSDVMDVCFKESFITPLGYSFEEETIRYYGIKEEVWANSFEYKRQNGSSVEVTGVPQAETVRCGDKTVNGVVVPKLAKKFTITFSGNIVGNTTFEGSSTVVNWLKNITAPYKDLVAMTELGYAGYADYSGYTYFGGMLDRIIGIRLRDSILDGIFINGKSLREIIAVETNFEYLKNYPIRVDLKDNQLIIYVQEDSAIYGELKEGTYLEFSSALYFECDNGIASGCRYVYDGETFALSRYVKSITVRTNKAQYYKGQDLDLSKFIAYTVYDNGEKGENFTLTADMISGYDKNIVGKQTITITYEGCTAELEITVLDVQDGGFDDNNNQESGCGCGSSINVGFVSVLVSLITVTGIILLRKKKKN